MVYQLTCSLHNPQAEYSWTAALDDPFNYTYIGEKVLTWPFLPVFLLSSLFPQLAFTNSFEDIQVVSKIFNFNRLLDDSMTTSYNMTEEILEG